MGWTLPLLSAALIGAACAPPDAGPAFSSSGAVADSAQPLICPDGSLAPLWYEDADGDGFGDPQHARRECEQPEGTAANAEDCDDGDAAISPLAVEVCNLVDDNCSGAVDDARAEDALVWYTDGDGDHYGDPQRPVYACEWPEGTVAPGDDCDDTDPTIGPERVWYPDVDRDGYGDREAQPGDLVVSCSEPYGYSESRGDCNDLSAQVHPGAEEDCGNSRDDDCDGPVDEGCG